jgi:hypothetical protein
VHPNDRARFVRQRLGAHAARFDVFHQPGQRTRHLRCIGHAPRRRQGRIA